ncbi:hypothetical protein JOD54_004332 [Actinokineospora baliensis]|uniref:glycine-rich domain-containing protein n=1 Tax=Actinokineospora baliensis TaxID=547056 RepID=UPI001958049A|nr:hypothetical protein [Actinokineospora baliensis]MBM7774128.1 hypothetical protein [Actinokineospora baliensis]
MGQLIREHAGMTGDEAVRIVNATVAFLVICAESPGKRFRPSKRVDLGWHMFILNTRDYAEFCAHLGAGFIHHVPDEFARPTATRTAMRAALAPTVEALTAAGFEVDAQLWGTDAGSCSQCHSGCTDCGQGGDDDGGFCR